MSLTRYLIAFKFFKQYLVFDDAAPTIEKQFSFWILLAWTLVILTDLLNITSLSSLLLLDEFIICPFRYFTGLLCPGCGMTRSFLSIGYDGITQAVSFNPIGPFFFSYLIYQISPIKFKITISNQKVLAVLKVGIVLSILIWWGVTRL